MATSNEYKGLGDSVNTANLDRYQDVDDLNPGAPGHHNVPNPTARNEAAVGGNGGPGAVPARPTSGAPARPGGKVNVDARDVMVRAGELVDNASQGLQDDAAKVAEDGANTVSKAWETQKDIMSKTYENARDAVGLGGDKPQQQNSGLVEQIPR